jgi:hypothetical protein
MRTNPISSPPLYPYKLGLEKRRVTPRTAKQEFMERLKTVRIRTGGNIHRAQARYKESFEKKVRPKNSDLKE